MMAFSFGPKAEAASSAARTDISNGVAPPRLFKSAT